MIDVFISYRRAERASVEPIRQKLEALGVSVFFDVHAIDGGVDFPDAIDQNLRASKAVIACWSELYFEPRLGLDWCKIECRHGLKKGTLIPVAIERFNEEAPPVYLQSVNYFDLSDWRGDETHEGWRRTLRALARNLGRKLNERAPQPPQDAGALVARGDSFVEQEDYDEAIAAYDDAIRLDPGSAIAFFKRGVAHHLQHHHDQAIADYDEAIRLDASLPKSFYNRGLIHQRQQRYEAAIADYDEAIRLDPQNADALTRRAAVHRGQKEYARAIADYTEAIRLDPRRAGAFAERAATYIRQDEYSRAIADYTEAIRLEPDDVVHVIYRGIAYRKHKDYDRAIADFVKAMEMAPEAIDPYEERGILFRERKDYPRALADFTEAIKRYPSKFYLTERGRTYHEMAEYESAIADYTEAVAGFRERISDSRVPWTTGRHYADIFTLRARSYRGLGDEARANADEDQAHLLMESARRTGR
jgi:tetratricopeptide (TPR) repeat protein